MFIFHFHNIFVMTYYVNIIVIDTLIHVGRIKMSHKHTHLPLCVLTACGHWTLRQLLYLIYRPRSTLIDWGLVTQYGDKILSSLVQVTMACHKVGATHSLNQWWYIVNWNLRNKLMWNYIAKQIVCVVKICRKMLSAKHWPFCSGFNVLL